MSKQDIRIKADAVWVEAEALCVEIIDWLDLKQKDPEHWRGMQAIFRKHFKAQRAEEARAMCRDIEETVDWADVTRNDVIDWLTQRAADLEKPS